jgi:hypothetical protein
MPAGGGGDSSIGCGRQMKIIAAATDQIDFDGVRFYRSAERCQAELARLAFLRPSGCR